MMSRTPLLLEEPIAALSINDSGSPLPSSPKRVSDRRFRGTNRGGGESLSMTAGDASCRGDVVMSSPSHSSSSRCNNNSVQPNSSDAHISGSPTDTQPLPPLQPAVSRGVRSERAKGDAEERASHRGGERQRDKERRAADDPPYSPSTNFCETPSSSPTTSSSPSGLLLRSTRLARRAADVNQAVGETQQAGGDLRCMYRHPGSQTQPEGERGKVERARHRRNGWENEGRWTHLPFYANLYLQVFLNAFLISIICYAGWIFFKGIRNDVHSKVQLHSKDIMERISLCARHYSENRCDPPSRVPALEKACSDWEACMNQDSGIIDKRSQLSAQTVGEVINAFLEQLSWKSALLLGAGFVVMVVGSNLALSLSRWTTPRISDLNKANSPTTAYGYDDRNNNNSDLNASNRHSQFERYGFQPTHPLTNHQCHRFRHTHSFGCLSDHH